MGCYHPKRLPDLTIVVPCRILNKGLWQLYLFFLAHMFLQKGNQSIDIVPGRSLIVEVIEDIIFKLGTVVQLFVDSRIALLDQEEAIHDLFVVSAHRFLYGRALEVFKWHN